MSWARKIACSVLITRTKTFVLYGPANLNIIFYHNLYIFPLISLRDIFSINGLTLILKVIGQCDVEAIMTLPIKTITSVLKDATNITTSIIPHPVTILSHF
jgi:hypothetical protein